MKKLGIKSIVIKKWKPSSQSKNKTVQKENIIKGVRILGELTYKYCK